MSEESGYKINLRISTNNSENTNVSDLLIIDKNEVKTKFLLKPNLFEACSAPMNRKFSNVYLPTSKDEEIYKKSVQSSVHDLFKKKPMLLINSYSQYSSENTLLYKKDNMDDTLFHHMLQDIFDYIKEDTNNHYLVTLNLCVVQNESLYDGFSTKADPPTLHLICDKDGNSLIRNVTDISLFSADQGCHLLSERKAIIQEQHQNEPFYCVYILTIQHEENEEYHSLSQCYIVDSPFLDLSSQKGLSNLYQNIYNIYQSKKQAKKHANKIWELCYLTKKCFEVPSSILLFFTINNEEIHHEDFRKLEDTLCIISPLDPSKTSTYRILHKNLRNDSVESTLIQPQVKNSEPDHYVIEDVENMDPQSIRTIYDTSILQSALIQLLEIMRNKEINANLEKENFEMQIRRECLQEFMEIDKQKQMNEKEYNEIDEQKYKLLLKQKDEECARCLLEKDLKIQELKSSLKESEDECRRFYTLYTTETPADIPLPTIPYTEPNSEDEDDENAIRIVFSSRKESLELRTMRDRILIHEKTIRRLKEELENTTKQLNNQVKEREEFERYANKQLDISSSNLIEITRTNDELNKEIDRLQSQIKDMNITINEQKKYLEKKKFMNIICPTKLIQQKQLKPLSNKPLVLDTIGIKKPLFTFVPLNERVKPRSQLNKGQIDRKNIPKAPTSPPPAIPSSPPSH